MSASRELVSQCTMSTPRGTISFATREWPDEKAKRASFQSRFSKRPVKPRNAGIVTHGFRRFAQLPQNLQLGMALAKPVSVVSFALRIGLSSEHRDIGASNEIDVVP